MEKMDPREHMTLRRLRNNPFVRQLVQEVRVCQEQLIQPLFVVEGLSEREEIVGLSGVFRETHHSLLKTVEDDLKKGVKQFLLFGVPQKKEKPPFDGKFTADQINALQKRFQGDLFLWADVCLCSWTEDGHCGILQSNQPQIDNAGSVDELGRISLAYAEAGVDGVAPSDMMDVSEKSGVSLIKEDFPQFPL
jgi:porphobilinogen synthase